MNACPKYVPFLSTLYNKAIFCQNSNSCNFPVYWWIFNFSSAHCIIWSRKCYKIEITAKKQDKLGDVVFQKWSIFSIFGRRHLLIKFAFCCYFNLISFAGPNDAISKRKIGNPSINGKVTTIWILTQFCLIVQSW